MLSRTIHNTHEVLRNYHFWIISALILAITAIYCFWPWVDWARYWRDFAVFEFKYKAIGFLFIIPFTYAFVIYRWPGILIVWFVIVAVLLQRLIQINAPVYFLVKTTFSLFIPLVIAAIISFASKWYKNKIQREIEHQVYVSQIIQAQEDERLRIAQELHDDTIQKLLVIANRAQTLLSDPDNGITSETKKYVVSVRDMILDVAEDMRKLSSELRPTVLDTIGLVPASISMVDNLNSQCNVNLSIMVIGKVRKLSSVAEVTIYRIIQEALSNIRQHSEATEATVTLQYFLTFVRLKVQDNGRGFSIPEALGQYAMENKFGLVGIRERARLLDGSFIIRSNDGHGTLLTIQVKC